MEHSLIDTKLSEIIRSCIKELYTKDFELIQNNVTERALTHKLAEYLQTRFPEYNVDCEYNRNSEKGKNKPKYLRIITEEAIKENNRLIKGGDFDSVIEVSTYPDIIVHRRLRNDENFIVIEVKKDNSRLSEDFDLMKLRAFTENSDENDYKYRYGVFIIIPIEDQSRDPEIRWFVNGKQVAT
jgi:hypothetical protein